MKSLTEHLTEYAGYHRDRRNIATHFAGIPMIVVAVHILASRPGLVIAGLGLSPAPLMALGAVLFYLRLDLRFGATMAALFLPCLWVGRLVAAESTSTWLGLGLGLFVVGWAFQFVGHYFEGRKPAFVDDLVGLLIGPLFIVAEAAFLLGLRAPLLAAIEARVGPTRIRGREARA